MINTLVPHEQVAQKSRELVDDAINEPVEQDYLFAENCILTGILMAMESQLFINSPKTANTMELLEEMLHKHPQIKNDPRSKKVKQRVKALDSRVEIVALQVAYLHGDKAPSALELCKLKIAIMLGYTMGDKGMDLDA